jgi:peptidoglycan/xylan/chitin deacetylase (PgdA/CDA1 family)
MSVYRIDRTVAVYLCQPLFHIMGVDRTGCPILMYHSISNDKEPRGHAYYGTATFPSVFAEHMRVIRDQGYSVIDLTALVTALDQGQIPRHSVVLTFDDGLLDFYLNAFPVLNSYGFCATVFLPTGYIGDTVRHFKHYDCMTWTQVRELHRAGVSFGSHTVTHPQLGRVNRMQQQNELRYSKSAIEDRLGVAVESFAYPFAFPEHNRTFTRQLREDLEMCGYRNGVCTAVGRATVAGDRLFLRRIPANSYDDMQLFRAKLDGAYDWLHTFQYYSKVLKGTLR